MNPSAALSATLENYLETIARLIADRGAARVRDISEVLSVHKSTVTAALKSLTEKGLVNYAPYEFATLTPQGARMAKRIMRRHEVIQRFLVEVLLLDKGMAEANACRMEHVLDKDVLERLRLFAEFVKECPRTGSDWLGRFRYFFEHGGRKPVDTAEAEQWLADFQQGIQEQKGKGETDSTMVTLDQLKPGQSATIRQVGKGGAVNRRIVDMGVVRGAPVKVIKVAPLGDPIEVKVKGYSLTLRKTEAKAITVEME